MTYIKLKREKIDTCNICQKTKDLTWDHVPPKSGVTLSTMEIENIYKILTDGKNPQKIFSQNGVKYRTICKDCNSRLGSEYDKNLNSLNYDVSLYLKSKLHLPSFTYIKTKPVRLIKAVLGQILAAKLTIDNSKFDKNVREYLFDDLAVLSNDIHILYWIYPYDCVVIQRDFGMPAVRGDMSDHIFCSILKYFPLAFIICDKSEYQGLPSLTKYRDITIDEEVELRIDLKRVETLDWPERIDGSNMIFASAETINGILAKPR